MTEENTSKPTRVWDLSTRLFHWSVVLLLLFQWLSVEAVDDWIEWHVYGGYAVLSLVLFRIIWGFAGTRYSRFSQFLYSPGKVFHYMKTLTDRDSWHYAGHNPLGGLSVILMLALIAIQAITGLFMTDDILIYAPYHGALSDDIQDLMISLHHSVFDILLIVTGIHIVAILYYRFYKNQHLVSAMIHGNKVLSDSKPISSDRNRLAFILMILAIVVVYLIVAVFPPERIDYFTY